MMLVRLTDDLFDVHLSEPCFTTQKVGLVGELPSETFVFSPKVTIGRGFRKIGCLKLSESMMF